MSNTFSTRDLYLAALIYVRGKFQKLDRQGHICWFIFEDANICEELQQQFFAKTARVNAKEYADALRTLKDLVFTKEQ